MFAPDLEALTDHRTAWCLHVAVTLRIAEQLAAGAADIAALAAAAHCDARVLQLVLRHLITKGFFEEPEPGRFELNEPARNLMQPGARLGQRATSGDTSQYDGQPGATGKTLNFMFDT